MSQLDTTSDGMAPAHVRFAGGGAIAMYLQLTKARLSLLVLWTTAVGYVLGAETVAGFHAARFLWTLLGTALVAGAANALNQVMEVGPDGRMQRTCGRPLPAGRLSRRHATFFALGLLVGGTAILAALAAPAAAALAVLTAAIYLVVYTPLKRRSTLNTLVGAVCGAIPPMIGWVAASGRLDPGAWALAALLFVWQIPHFLALAWLYREDYARGRFVMLPVVDREGDLTCRIVVVTSLMLTPLALSAALLGLAGWVYAIGAAALGLWLVLLGVRLYRGRSDADARRVFHASLVYLSAVLMLLVIDR